MNDNRTNEIIDRSQQVYNSQIKSFFFSVLKKRSIFASTYLIEKLANYEKKSLLIDDDDGREHDSHGPKQNYAERSAVGQPAADIEAA